MKCAGEVKIKKEKPNKTRQLPRGKGVGEGRTGSLGLADANYYIWMNTVLLYSIGNCIQYPVINHNGRKNRQLEI